MPNLTKEEAERYKRHLSLKGFGESAQLKLKNSSVLVVGAGGLGCPALVYLTASGVGSIGIVDGDTIALSNLQRQTLFEDKDIGQKKSETAKETLIKRNPHVNLKQYSFFINPNNCLDIVGKYDLVLDCSDNFDTRYLLNDTCVVLNKPLIYAALHEYEGQLSVFNFENGPTLRCLFPMVPKNGIINNCADQGVLAVLPGIIGALQAQEAVKIITGIGNVLSGKLLIYNALDAEMKTISVALDPNNRAIKSLDHFKDLDENEIDKNTLEIWQNTERLQLIDVREFVEFKHQNIGGINIPTSSLAARASEIDLTQKTVLICQTGKRSAAAMQFLKKILPAIDVYHLRGGLNGYLL